MQSIIDFFLQPYLEATWLNIFLEVVAVIFGVISVAYAIREDIKVYPTGIISTAIFIYLLYVFGLFGDMIVNIYYTIMSIYGWYVWCQGGTDSSEDGLSINYTQRQDRLISVAIFISTAIFVIVVYKLNHRFNQWTDYVDTVTTGLFFTAMWLMAKKKIESWYFWIIANIISIPLYFVKGLGFTGLQYIIFLVLAIIGLKKWKEIYNRKIEKG